MINKDTVFHQEYGVFIEEESKKTGQPVKSVHSIPGSWPRAHSLITEEVRGITISSRIRPKTDGLPEQK